MSAWVLIKDADGPIHSEPRSADAISRMPVLARQQFRYATRVWTDGQSVKLEVGSKTLVYRLGITRPGCGLCGAKRKR